jgi:hypothetical protein
MVATFERFLRDLFTQELSKLTVSNPPPVSFASLPQSLRVSSVFGSLEFAMKGRLASNDSGRAARLPGVQRAAQLVVDGVIDAAALSETGGNPSAERVTALFKSVGVKTVFESVRPAFEAEWPKPETADFLAAKLDEIVNSRHRVAHLADGLSISRAQLAEWPTFLSVLSGLLSTRLENHINALFPP